MAPVPTLVGAPRLTGSRSTAGLPGGLASASGPFASPRVVSLVALALSIIGVFLPWATTDAAFPEVSLRASVAGVDLGAGRLLCAVLVVVLLFSGWHLAATSRATGIALFCSWLGALALSVYEIVDIIAVPTRGLALDVGVGLYVCGFATLTGSVSTLTDGAQLWSVGGPARPVAAGVMWAGGLVALGVVAGASFLGYRAGASPVGPIPALSPEQPVPNGGGGPGPVGGGSTGGTGSTGNSGNVGGSGDSGSSGTTGSSGNTGLGNSGSGNSGSGGFGNSGPGGFGPGPFGNSGTGNSGAGGVGISSPGGAAGPIRLIPAASRRTRSSRRGSTRLPSSATIDKTLL